MTACRVSSALPQSGEAGRKDLLRLVLPRRSLAGNAPGGRLGTGQATWRTEFCVP